MMGDVAGQHEQPPQSQLRRSDRAQTSDVYVAWAVDHDGEWQQVAAWGPVPGPSVSVEGACSWQVTELSTIVITTSDPDEILASGQTSDT